MSTVRLSVMFVIRNVVNHVAGEVFIHIMSVMRLLVMFVIHNAIVGESRCSVLTVKCSYSSSCTVLMSIMLCW